MRVLLIGSGAREHALGWKLAQSQRVTSLFCLPGNPGLGAVGTVIGGFDSADPAAVAAVARVYAIDIVVVGPEAPLAAGVADGLAAVGVPCFGPTQRAARLESSKTYAKELMDRAGVATPRWWSFSDAEKAHAHLDAQAGPFVVKADGLAAGKGVLVTSDLTAAHDWVDKCQRGDFGMTGRQIVVEEFAPGREVSVFALCAGDAILPLAPARDYKRLRDGDLGPNTGGMGAYSPVNDLPDGFVDEIVRTVFKPVLETMAVEDNPYLGFLYAGLIIGDEGISVLEFNCRLGDPETQVVLPRLQTDLIDIVEAGVDGRLSACSLSWSEQAAVGVVLATAGYPERSVGGQVIHGLPEATQDCVLFHGSTTGSVVEPVTAGGRAINVVGLGPSVGDARATAYREVERITFEGMTFRSDIGQGG